ncbi:MAG: TonB-dependent receptor [Prevotellaceae bacterium]|nr:TonB-dependent receptor [Prevotellaceae bacterium]
MKNRKKESLSRRADQFRQLCLIALLLMLGIGAYAQSGPVTGTVTDNSGEPLLGAKVMVKGTNNATVTDTDGKFSLQNVPGNGTLEISFMGFQTQNVLVRRRARIQVVLQEDQEAMEEVIVVGYGVQKKSDVTGAVARVGEKELKAMPTRNALEGMQGKIAGVDITSSQRPGELGSINVRGVRSISADQAPLYVVDGMVIQNGGIDNINPSDIETIDVLKDASATAIYGSRGANGVILITTKKGKEGQLHLNYSGTVTVDKMVDVTKYMSASEWLDYSRLAKYNMGAYASATPDYNLDKAAYGSVSASWANIEKAWTQQADGSYVYDPSAVGSYNWASQGKQTGITHEHTLSASGGTEKMQGYGSFGYLKQKGTQPGQSYDRYTMKVSVDMKPTKWFSMGATINGSYAEQDYGYSFTKSVTGAGDYYSALQSMLPWTVPYDENGDYIRLPNGDVNIINPINELEYNTNRRKTFRASGAVYGQLDFGQMWKPLEGLSYRLQFGPEFQYYTLGIANAAEGINGDGNNGVRYSPYNKVAWTLDNLIYYNRTFAKIHSVGITLMQSASKYHYEYADMRATNVASADELWYNISSGGSLSSFGTSLTESQMASYMMRVNYGLMDRYLLTASIRWDGASQLAPGHKWAKFPSLALAWRINQEDFLKDVTWLSNLKLRLGVGVTGNAAISAYATKGAIQTLYYNWGTTDSSIGYVPSDPSSASPAKMANQDLGWEKTTQYNLGIDFGFFDNRLNGSFDLYKTKTSDLLLSMTIPSLTGYTSTYANVGETSGWGIDLMVDAFPVKNKNFQWESTFTWSLDRSTIKKLSNGRTEDVDNLWFVGEEIGVYYDYVYDGIWKTDEAEEAAKYGRQPGQIKVKDLNGDGVIDANNDRTIVGRVRPRWSGGWTNTFSYKNFELSFFIYSRWGFTVPQGSVTLDGRYMMRKLDYWVAGTNENAKYYAPGSNGEAADTYASSMNYQDGSFIKVRNISLGYNFDKKLLKKAGIDNLKIYVQAMNPFNIYKACSWLDTDLLSYANNTTTYGSGTTIKSFVVGLNIGF